MKPIWDLLEDNLGANFAEDRELHQIVRELSHAFTEGREGLPRDYLNDPELQAAYLAYFVPLNFEKVFMLLSSVAGVWPKELDAARPLRWVDFGSGPGTASLAALAALRKRFRKLDRLPRVEIDLVDTQTGALNLADNLVRQLAEKLKIDVEVRLATSLPDGPAKRYDFALAANVLNELPAESGAEAREALLQLWDATSGVMLVLEPGHRVSSSRLVRFRERFLKEFRDQASFLGPCTHAERCPVYRTKHWCHFSEPVTDGRLIDLNLRIFKNPRGWLKFSYLLVKRGEPMPAWDGQSFRAIGDLHMKGPKNLAIDLCKPNEKFVLVLPRNIPPELRGTLVRGASVKYSKDHKATARPMTKREPAPLLAPRESRPPVRPKRSGR